MAESIYAKGIYFNKLPDNTPDSVKKWKKGSIAVHIDNAIEHLKSLKEYENDKGYIYYDLTQNEKDGEKFYSFKLNTWKPESTIEKPEYPSEDIKPEDIPF